MPNWGYDISSSKGERYKPMVDLGGWVRSSNESNIQKKQQYILAIEELCDLFRKHRRQASLYSHVGQECWSPAMTSRVCSIAVCLRMKCTILPWYGTRLSMQVLEARLWHLSLHV